MYLDHSDPESDNNFLHENTLHATNGRTGFYSASFWVSMRYFPFEPTLLTQSKALSVRVRASLIIGCVALLPGYGAEERPATVTLIRFATLSYNGTVNENKIVDLEAAYYGADAGGNLDAANKLDVIRVAPGDKVIVKLENPGKILHIGTWDAPVKYRVSASGIGRDVGRTIASVFCPSRGSINPSTHLSEAASDDSLAGLYRTSGEFYLVRGGDGPVYNDTHQPVDRNKALGDADWIKVAVVASTSQSNQPHQLTPQNAEVDLGFFKEAGEIILAGSVDRRFPPDSDFTGNLREGTVTGDKQEVDPRPDRKDWYVAKVTIERIPAP